MFYLPWFRWGAERSGGLYLSCLWIFLDTLHLEHLELFFIFSILPQKIYSRRQRQIGVWTFVSGWPGVYPVISVPDFIRKGEHILCLKTNLKGIRKFFHISLFVVYFRWEFLKRQDRYYLLEVPRGSHWISHPVEQSSPTGIIDLAKRWILDFFVVWSYSFYFS